jgi:ATP sulfurylase
MINDRIQPHRHENARVHRRTPGLPFHRFHERIQRRQIQPTDPGPHDPRRMVVVHQVVDPARQGVFTLAIRTP